MSAQSEKIIAYVTQALEAFIVVAKRNLCDALGDAERRERREGLAIAPDHCVLRPLLCCFVCHERQSITRLDACESPATPRAEAA